MSVPRLAAVAFMSVGFALAAAAPAAAWWAEGSSYRSGAYGVVLVHAEPGERNDVTAQHVRVPSPLPASLDAVLLHDPSTPVTAAPAGHGAGCTQLDAHTLRCQGVFQPGITPRVAYLEVDLGDGDDRLRTTPGSSLFKLGTMGPGNDAVDGDDTDGASIDLGDGDDSITLRGSMGGLLPSDAVLGGPGDDVLNVLNGSAGDAPVCGDGNDTLYADPGESDATCETHLP